MPKFEVTAQVEIRTSFTVTVDAADEEEAMDQLERDIEMELCGSEIMEAVQFNAEGITVVDVSATEPA